MLKIGMTGGIASGKSQAAKLFMQLGCTIIDTDVIAHQLVEPNTSAWQAIITHFGKEILNFDQTINRRQLSKIIFARAAEKQWLEALLHPKIRQAVQQQIEKQPTASYYIIVIPLLVETLPNPTINRILVIDTKEENQLQRAIQRDHNSTTGIKTIMANQASRQQRLSVADDVIENNGSLTKLAVAVQKMHNFYLNLTENAT